MKSKALCVLGMHRSGTSAMAGSLAQLGARLGENLVPAKAGVNERGFFEHDAVVDVHERLLSALGYSWDDVRLLPDRWWERKVVGPIREDLLEVIRKDFSSAPLWALKDPRMCRLLPLWFELFERVGCEPDFVIVFRHPREVARSLESRDGFAPEKSLLLWLYHNVEAERWSRGHKRVFVAFDQLLADPAATIRRIGGALGCAWPVPLETGTRAVASFLEPSLRHHSASAARGEPEAATSDPMIDDLFDALTAATGGETDAIRARFVELERRFAERTGAFDVALTSHIRDVQQRLQNAQGVIERIGASVSWRITRPLRGVKHFWKLLFSRPE